MKDNSKTTRREFISKTGLASAGIALVANSVIASGYRTIKVLMPL